MVFHLAPIHGAASPFEVIGEKNKPEEDDGQPGSWNAWNGEDEANRDENESGGDAGGFFQGTSTLLFSQTKRGPRQFPNVPEAGNRCTSGEVPSIWYMP